MENLNKTEELKKMCNELEETLKNPEEPQAMELLEKVNFVNEILQLVSENPKEINEKIQLLTKLAVTLNEHQK